MRFTGKKIVFCIFLFLFGFMIISCSAKSDFSLIQVNGEIISHEEIQHVLQRYEDKGEFIKVSEEDVVKSAIEEVLVLQQAGKLGITVDEAELDHKMDALKNMNQSLFYDLAIKQYGDIGNYREALKLRMLYQGTRDKIMSDYVKDNPIDVELVKAEMVSEGVIQDKSEYDKEENSDLVSQFTHSYVLKKGKEYFDEWVHSLVENANIEYVYR
ncbi:SurA N-terminal domain-containing protein [Paenibacillus thiaminolyticus]|uniref:SurA N-terminal domain-containing protein n=1 Tax=Paenibacillus thiaminolyticus TaxID=49283 RepID=A0AAP9DXG8_PANTH|nr:SurA N-terminal domain-containing protein [Paenibacillus thiaminolyticus]MCY9535298.1 SurA N-terminal domain-containing protein [Paenibacillus thiaminolyticus]MCY9602559.1 SurA N-terminal domain-containing protein [Paenibacillus thiaminolyticus]MCY9606211.1 SurA N-terminal domain-containing protein [Paenibacillus thiaminolyticus]MCY9612596.1 SurA N-terminal domain-containing protein [Paenibacillus thiaminolyticus]MCY9620775.1 SurA N-terminal domain-containing protein [Paenibacillus thiamino